MDKKNEPSETLCGPNGLKVIDYSILFAIGNRLYAAAEHATQSTLR